jgi:FGGY family of carbohydrate kinases, C-terminal domain
LPEKATQIARRMGVRGGEFVYLGIDIGTSGVKAVLVNKAGARILATPDSELLTPLGEAVERPSPVQFLPYLDGERTPRNGATAASVFVDLRSATGRDDIVPAVVEGVAFAARDNLAALGGSNAAIAEFDLMDSGSRSALWAQIIADVLGIPVHRVEEAEVGDALGAAWLGRLADTGEEPAHELRAARFEVPAYDDAYRMAKSYISRSRSCPPERITIFFATTEPVAYGGPKTDKPRFRWCDKDRIVRGWRLEDHLCFDVCYGHSFRRVGSDPFGGDTFLRPWHHGDDPMALARPEMSACSMFRSSLSTTPMSRRKAACLGMSDLSTRLDVSSNERETAITRFPLRR